MSFREAGCRTAETHRGTEDRERQYKEEGDRIMNRLTIIGNLTADPEGRVTQAGKEVCTFTVAVNRRGKEQGADYFRVSAWNELAKVCKNYLAKGRKVCVIGAVRASAYTNKSGEAAASLEVMASEVEFLSPKEQGGYTPVNDPDDPFAR